MWHLMALVPGASKALPPPQADLYVNRYFSLLFNLTCISVLKETNRVSVLPHGTD